MVMRFSNRNTSGFQGSGSYGGSFGFLFDASSIYYFNGSQLVITPTLISGVVAVAGAIGYRNGMPESGTIVNGPARREIYVGALNTSTGANYFQTGTIAAVAIYKPTEPSTTPMSAADVAALTTRMQALA